MDDVWFSTLPLSHTSPKSRPQQRRRTSLLQQPAATKADQAVETARGHREVHRSTRSPPAATVAKRAESYSDFYDAATSYARQEQDLRERRASDSRQRSSRIGYRELEYEIDFSALETELSDQNNDIYGTHRRNLQASNLHLQNLVSQTQTTLRHLFSLSNSFKAVETQSTTFRQRCDSLVIEQKRLEALADSIEENASYYAYLEPMTRRLNTPGAANLVTRKDFPEILSSLDNCLAYMEAHPSHRESATYRGRYRLLLTRGLTLIRHYFTKSLGDIAADVSKRVQGGQLKDTTHSALLYAKFRVPAPELKSLGLEIQKRAVPTPEDVDAGREPEYLSLLRELYQSYSATRGRLMLPLVHRKMAELAASSDQSDMLAFGRSSISFMRGTCLDEYDLWFEWFETDGALYDFLESLIEPMFDYLRPRIVHETRLDTLCEVCAMIQGQYMDLDSEDESEHPASAVVSPVANGRFGVKKLDFAALVQPALEDAQTRLVFLALNALRNTIELYKPTEEDLHWPRTGSEKVTNRSKKGPVLSGKRAASSATATSTKLSNGADVDVDDGASMVSKQFASTEDSKVSQQWYPTLTKAVSLLRRIYRLVNSSVFDDLAHRIVHSTIYSLVSASQLVGSRKTVPDGQLFLITHLLHLKQQIIAFDIEFIPPEVEFDFSSVTNTFYELRNRGSLWNPTSWVRLVSGAVGGGLFPKVVENMLDAKAELDGRLRTVINEFVNGYANHITAPIEASTVSQAQAANNFDALKAIRTVRGLAEKDVPALRAKLQGFVQDSRTRETLVAAVRDQVAMSYEEFFDNVSEGQSRKLSRKGKGREDEIWGPDVFAEAMEKVFQVGQVVADNDDDDDASSSGGGGFVSD